MDVVSYSEKFCVFIRTFAACNCRGNLLHTICQLGGVELLIKD